MKIRKKIIALLLTLVTCLNTFSVVVSANEDIQEDLPLIVYGDGSGEILQDGRDVIPSMARGITAAGDLGLYESSGGRGSINYSHYGNYKYDGRAYFKNLGSRTIKVQTYTATGYKVHTVQLEPGKDVTCYFNQSILKYELMDGTGNFHFQTLDGGNGRIEYRYNVLD